MSWAIVVLIAALTLLPMLAWIGALLWAARRDGRDEADFRRTHPPADDAPPAPPADDDRAR